MERQAGKWDEEDDETEAHGEAGGGFKTWVRNAVGHWTRCKGEGLPFQSKVIREMKLHPLAAFNFLEV
jgi:hypothetical protein